MNGTDSIYIKQNRDAYCQRSLLGIFILFLLFPYFKTSGFDAISSGLNTFCNGMLLLEAIGLFVVALLTLGISPFSWAVIAFEVWNYGIAVLLSGNQMPSLFYLSGAVGVILLFDIGFRCNFILMLDMVCFIFTAFVLLNLLIVLLKPNGLGQTSNGTVYLFGIRTGFSLVVIPAIAFCVFRDSCRERQSFSGTTLLCMACSVVTLVMQWVATGIVELLIFFTLYFLARRNNRVKFNIWAALLISGLLDYMIVYQRAQNIFSGFIVGFLHKDLTLSGRTDIWDAVISAINRSPVFGFGETSSVTVYDNIQKACHNQWLYIAHESGYVGFVLFLIGIVVSFKIAHQYKQTNFYKIFVMMAAAVLVATISEIQLYVPFFYALLSFPAQWKHFSSLEKTTLPALFPVSQRSTPQNFLPKRPGVNE